MFIRYLDFVFYEVSMSLHNVAFFFTDSWKFYFYIYSGYQSFVIKFVNYLLPLFIVFFDE